MLLQKTAFQAVSINSFDHGLEQDGKLPAATAASHHIEEEGFSPHLVGMWIAFVIAAGLITFFTGKISDALRKRDRDVLTLQEQVAKSERLASLVTLAAGAAHELGTPLGTIAIVAGELEHYAGNIARNDAVLVDSRLIRSEVERCRRILERMSAQSAERWVLTITSAAADRCRATSPYRSREEASFA